MAYSPLTASREDTPQDEHGSWLEIEKDHGKSVREHVKAAMEEHRVPDVRKTPERRQQDIGRAGYVEAMKREGREDLIPRDWDPAGKGHPEHKREHEIRAAVHTTFHAPSVEDLHAVDKAEVRLPREVAELKHRPEYASSWQILHGVWRQPETFLTKREMDAVGINHRYPASDDRRYSNASMTALFDLLQSKRNKGKK